MVVLGYIRKQTEQANGSKPESSIIPWPLLQLLIQVDCSEFLPIFPLMKHSVHKPFFPQLLLVRQRLITVIENRRNSISIGFSGNLTISLFWMSIKLEMTCYFHLCSCYIAQLSVT